MVLLSANQLGRSKVSAEPAIVVPAPRLLVKDGEPGAVWAVEQTDSRTLYSNGLTIQRSHETESVPRRFRVYDAGTLERSETLSTPAGIVFHSTESLILPLEQGQNGALLKTRENLLDHARKGRLYNFVIDRFGEVFAIVPEQQTALHAGRSIWASGDQVWVDLNESFVGISFEAESTVPFQPTTAQIHSGRLLTEMLRARYAISEENCVTHAQVSINPDNMRIGYHTDWGSAFPFREVGLPDNYSLPVAAVAVFGFSHDETFLQAIGNRPWPGLVAADQQIAAQGSRLGLEPHELSARLQQRYTNLRRQRHE